MAHFLLIEDGTFLLQEDSNMLLLDGNFVENDPLGLSAPTIDVARIIEVVAY